MQLSLKAKFLGSTIALLVLGMGISTVVSVQNSNNTLDRISKSQQAAYVDLTLRQVNAWITDRKLEMLYWGKQDVFSVAIDGAFIKMADKELAELKKDYDFYEIINVADTSGAIIASSDKAKASGLSVSDRSYFKKALSGTVAISDVIKSKSSGNPVFVVAAPVRQDTGFVGVIFGVVDLEYFNENFIAPVKFGATGFVYVVGPSGLVIAHPDTSKIMRLDLSDYDFGKEMLQNKSGILTCKMDSRLWTAAYKTGAAPPWTVVATAAIDELRAPGRQLRNINVIIAAAVIGLAFVVIFFIARTVVRPIYNAIDTLTESSDQMTNSAQQVASASQVLAQTTSQQAASLEETSASLEELSSVSQKNSASALKAKQLANDAKSTAGEGAASMNRLISAMDGISESSTEVTKVVKAIEEIAFQTNLLALNAAVEAARAGEAGRGFAVVAEEVRNLAQRSAEQAQATRQLIDESTARTKDGTQQAGETNNALQKIIDSINKVTTLVEEISSASDEQARGVEQINHAVSEMDKVVQQNSASSEESASSSEQVSAEAQELKGIIQTLTRIVEGGSSATNSPVSGNTERSPGPDTDRSGAQSNARDMKMVGSRHDRDAADTDTDDGFQEF